MTAFRSTFVAAAALALCQGQLAQAATAAEACISENEMTGLVGFALPSALDGAMRGCKPHLATTGYFATRGGEFLERYAARKDANWPMAKSAFLKFGGSGDAKMKDTFSKLPDEAVKPFVEAMVSEMVGSEIKPGQCKAIERGVRLLAPLPPENTAELVSFILTMAPGAKGSKASALPICKAAD
ncbi:MULTISPECIES: hypothetical protein [unclassified Novosphingobium]|uniref:hypothetical protein n=1 Tax=unclassified Novosphingobium TaxID=2644732 RepID=UPI0025CB8DAA|nr:MULTISPECIES: hypothetical protein [unclassified Novosphingobium]